MVKRMKKAAKTAKSEPEYNMDSGGKEETFPEVEGATHYKDAQGKDIYLGGYVRVQARVTRDNFEFIKLEANRTGTNVSAIVSIYIADMVEKAKKERGFTGTIV